MRRRISAVLLGCGLALRLCSDGSAGAQPVPWVLPWNDSSPGVTDFSGLNPPVGPDRVAVDADGHFVANGKPVRFLGFNFAGNSPFMPTNQAEVVAARLAKFGVNVIRFHHMDSSWAYGGGLVAYRPSSSTNLNPAQLERLHYIVSRLKAHGIYSDINLLVGREYRAGDGLGPEVTRMDWKDAHILGFFDDRALALQQDYATKLLAPRNPFTGLPLARDPAVAFVEIINENGIIQNWLERGLDRLPARYAATLQARWNAWLAARYSNQGAMLAAWEIIDQPLGPNLLPNGAFANGFNGWITEEHESAHATFTPTHDFLDGQPSARVSVTQPDDTGWHIQLSCPGFRVAAGQTYTLSFWAKASFATNCDAAVGQAHEPWGGLGCYREVALTTNWQQFSNTFQASATDANARLSFGSLGNKRATFWFADARLQPGGQLGALPPGASLASRSVPNLRHSGQGYTGTREARRAWLRFLRDLEYRYYDSMVAHLRTNIGYTGLVFGTILACSPATVQARMDVVDGHAYWQHPQFPGRPWDSANWVEPNISLVNTLDDGNTIAGLARQRIQGKPFTVTEYQHPSPNYYGAEGPLLLAAYAGLQDWDGLWLFDYGMGTPAEPLGYVTGYFDTAQHPGKMANLLLAANLFRRGDVHPAATDLTVSLSPDQEVDLLANAGAWGLFSSGQLGVSGKLAFVRRLYTNLRGNPSRPTLTPPPPVGSTLVSAPPELRWDASRPGKGLVTVDTPRTKALVGFADDQPVRLGELMFQPGATRLGWCTLGATLIRGQTFTNDCTALIVATGWWENTGQVWTDQKKSSVGTHWGRAPVLAEVVPFSLTLPVATNRVAAWSLDERGQRKAALPLAGDAAATTLTVGLNAASLWYELEVTR
jgi:hypothetical protein